MANPGVQLGELIKVLHLRTAVPQDTTPSASYGIPFGAFPTASSTVAVPSASLTPTTTYDAGIAADPTAVPPLGPDTSGSDGGVDPSDEALLGRATIQNNCQFPVYVWPVGETIHTEVTISASHEYSEAYRIGEGGIALKIGVDKNALMGHAPLMIFAYNVSGGKVWYNLADVSGDPLQGHRVEISPSTPRISWANGQPPAESQVRVLDSSTSITLTLC
ncbi:Antigenic thaumatin-like protein [Penicillium chermesinum]|nr:Antigenic thaumatin-like protein [Penicillium chermesinum]